MPHPLTADLGSSYFNATTLTNNPFETHALVLTAITLPVLSWTEDFFTEQTVFFWLERAVVDRLGFFDLTV